ncbi:MAG: Rpn family recombination-promoting nuclease/putative transposase [Planctomycetes bacterium]|nr:Rpn family recombination-promoting nuclease/putative transposase [Planctomycetota bacterium]
MKRRRGKPHDRLLRAVMRRPADARAVLGVLLPAEIRGLSQFESLRRVPGSFVDERLAARFSDVLFSVRARGEDLLVYVLVEHVRTAPRRLPLHVLCYVTRVLEQHDESHPLEDTLPRVVALVIHQGDAPYRGARRMADLFPSGEDSPYARFSPEVDFVFADLASIPDDVLLGLRLMGAAFSGAALLLMKYVGDEKLSRRMASWTEVLQAAVAGGPPRLALRRLLTYLNKAARDEAAAKALARSVPEGEEVYMTLEKRLLQEGRAEGRSEGRVEGRSEGRVEGRSEGRAEGRSEGRAEGRSEAMRVALIRLLESRFGPLDAAIRARLEAAELASLEAWFDRALKARSLEEVLATP